MKRSVLLVALSWATFLPAARAQNPAPTDYAAVEARRNWPANYYWHWYESIADATARVQSRPGWVVQDVSTSGTHKTVSFAATNPTQTAYISLEAWHGTLGRITYAYASNRDEGGWIIEQATPQSDGLWTDKATNATITRRYNGELVLYTITYHPYSEPEQ